MAESGEFWTPLRVGALFPLAAMQLFFHIVGANWGLNRLKRDTVAGWAGLLGVLCAGASILAIARNSNLDWNGWIVTPFAYSLGGAVAACALGAVRKFRS
jgi:hypothetical protein